MIEAKNIYLSYDDNKYIVNVINIESRGSKNAKIFLRDFINNPIFNR